MLLSGSSERGVLASGSGSGSTAGGGASGSGSGSTAGGGASGSGSRESSGASELLVVLHARYEEPLPASGR